ncbi:MAG: RND family transporter [Polyangiales bacterium]
MTKKTLLGLSIALVCGIFAALGILRLEPHFDPKALLDLDSSVLEEAREFEALFGPAAEPAAFVLESENILDEDGLARIHALSLAASAHGTVVSLTHLPLPHIALPDSGEGDLDATLSLLESAPRVFPNGLVDLGERFGGELAVGPIADTPELNDEQRDSLVAAAARVEGRLINRAHTRALVLVDAISIDDAYALAAEHDAQVTGIALLQHRIESGMQSEGVLLIGVALLLTVLLLGLAFRSLTAVSLPMLAAGVTLLLTMGALGWWTGRLTLLTAILPPVLLTICVGDALHLMARYAEERAADATNAATRTRRVMWRACLATTLTTAIGFGSLASASTPALQTFGFMCAAGVFVAFLVVVQGLPALLGRSSWSGRRFRGEVHAKVALWCAARPKLVLLVAAVVTAACAFGAFQLEEGTRLLSPFGQDEPLAQTARLVDSDFGGVRQMECLVRGEPLAADTLARADALGDWARSQPNVSGVRSLSSLMNRAWTELSDEPRPAAANEPLAALLGASTEGLISAGALRVQLDLRDAPADEMRALGIAAREHGADALSGEAWHAGAGLSSLQTDLITSFGLAFAGVFVIILFLFGPRLALAALPANALPMACIVGWMGMRNLPLDVGTAMVFAVTLGLVVDGTLHVLARYREESKNLEATFRGAGPAVVLGGAVLFVGFAALFFSSLQPLRQFAELASVALVCSVVAELTLLPAMLRLVASTARRGRSEAC